MNDPHRHPVMDTLTANDVERLRAGLVREVEASLDSAESSETSSRIRQRSGPALVGVVAVAALVVGLITFDVGRAPSAAEAMFTITEKGDWIDIAPNLAVDEFDADAAVEQLRANGFNAERGTFLQWLDANGDRTIAAPDTDGLSLSSHAFFFGDGTEVMFNIEGPVGAEFPTTSDGTRLDWAAAADKFGLRNPMEGREGLELRHGTSVTIWVLTAP